MPPFWPSHYANDAWTGDDKSDEWIALIRHLEDTRYARVSRAETTRRHEASEALIRARRTSSIPLCMHTRSVMRYTTRNYSVDAVVRLVAFFLTYCGSWVQQLPGDDREDDPDDDSDWHIGRHVTDITLTPATIYFYGQCLQNKPLVTPRGSRITSTDQLLHAIRYDCASNIVACGTDEARVVAQHYVGVPDSLDPVTLPCEGDWILPIVELLRNYHAYLTACGKTDLYARVCAFLDSSSSSTHERFLLDEDAMRYVVERGVYEDVDIVEIKQTAFLLRHLAAFESSVLRHM